MKDEKLLKSGGGPFCSDDGRWFPCPHAGFGGRFIFEPISGGRKLQRHALNLDESNLKEPFYTTFKTLL